MEIQKPQYWILDSVIKFELPLSLLVSDYLEETLNREGHGLAYDELVATLFGLFENGDLFAQCMSSFLGRKQSVIDSETGYRIPRRPLGDKFRPALEEIEAGLQAIKPIDYGLTSQGGAKWEAISNPRWARYLHSTYVLDTSKNTAEREAEIISMDKTLVEQYFAFVRQWTDVLVEGSARWDSLTPWEVKYWKTLPVGHRVVYFCKSFPEDALAVPEFKRWLSNIRNWYTNPYR